MRTPDGGGDGRGGGMVRGVHGVCEKVQGGWGCGRGGVGGLGGRGMGGE